MSARKRIVTSGWLLRRITKCRWHSKRLTICSSWQTSRSNVSTSGAELARRVAYSVDDWRRVLNVNSTPIGWRRLQRAHLRRRPAIRRTASASRCLAAQPQQQQQQQQQQRCSGWSVVQGDRSSTFANHGRKLGRRMPQNLTLRCQRTLTARFWRAIGRFSAVEVLAIFKPEDYVFGDWLHFSRNIVRYC